MRKNGFCTFTLIASLALAALPSSLAAAGTGGATTPASAPSLPTQQEMTLTIAPASSNSYDPEGSSFTAYRVMSFTQGQDGNWVWGTTNGFTYPGNGTFDADAFGTYPAAKLQDLAQQLALQVDDTTMTDKLPEKELTEGSCSWTTTKAGIYLVCETATKPGNFPSQPFLVALPYTDEENENSWKYSLTAAPKGSTVSLQKVIHDAKGSYLNEATYEGSKDTVANGDTVQYRITTRIPDYTQVFFADGKNPTFELVDTMVKGLTLTPATVQLTSGETTLTKDTDYTQSIATDEDGITTLTVRLTKSYLEVESHRNKEIVLAYSAAVNDSVSLAADGNENIVTLHYSYDPTNPDDTKEVEDEAKVYSFGIEIEKFNGDSDNAQKEKLAGAEFALYKETTKGCSASEALSQEPYRAVGVTNENGLLDFKALDAGTYYLKEVKAPDGYGLLMNPIKVEIIPASSEGTNGAEVISSGSFTAKVNGVTVSGTGSEGVSRILNAANREGTVVVSAANHHGFSLPSTGGTGIVLILVISLAGLITVTGLYLRGDRGTKGSSRVQAK